jgi:CheY-like chemotaxis protein
LGSTFTIKLPLKDSGEEISETIIPLNSQSAQSSLSILLIEDHEPTRSTLTNLLIRRQHSVTSVGSAGEALHAATRQKFNLVLSDIGLPDSSGYSLMKELRDKHGLRGIALTGYGMEHDIEKSRNAGFFMHLTKPIHIATLEKALRQVC